MTAARPEVTVKNCVGCRDDFYNGHNDLGVTVCWHLRDAKLVKRLLIPIDLPPPYKKTMAETVPNCYHRERCVTIKPEALDAKGYWK